MSNQTETEIFTDKQTEGNPTNYQLKGVLLTVTSEGRGTVDQEGLSSESQP